MKLTYVNWYFTTFFSLILTLNDVLSFAQQHQTSHKFNGVYSGQYLNRIAFPIGGIGAGMFCIEGTGAISHMSVRNSPDVFNEPQVFAAISIKEIPNSARVLESQVPDWKRFGQRGAARGAEGTTFGLARFRESNFISRFPFGEVQLVDKDLPLSVTITGWSPFIPGDPDNSSLPVGALEYHFKNTGNKTFTYIFSYNAANFMALQDRRAAPNPLFGTNRIKPITGGFVLDQAGTERNPEQQSAFAIFTDEPNVTVNHCWFRGGWWDPLSIAWDRVATNDLSPVDTVSTDAPGASLYTPFTLEPGQEKTIRVMMAWYCPNSTLRTGPPIAKPTDSAATDQSVHLPSKFYKPWYSSQYANIEKVGEFWRINYTTLKEKSALFSAAFYNSTLPAEVIEAVAANLTILKSPTVMRQYDGRFWGWEGCNDNQGSCAGSCTHVYNYAQSLANIFPSMERSIRETEFSESMDALGHQNYRTALPIRPAGHQYYFAAADGQLGGIMRAYRDWRISGNSQWIKNLYPKIKLSLDYCITSWDPAHKGVLEEPHHNTYDIEFWGQEPMCTSIYLGALEAVIAMGTYLHEDVHLYQELLHKGRAYLENNLFNGEYFEQHIQWEGLKAPSPIEFAKNASDGGEIYSPEATMLLEKEGPKYQYGKGCLSDGVIGAWEALVCGLPAPIDTAKVKKHLLAVYKYNYKPNLSDFSNPQRPSFALGNEGGLLLCTWPRGGKLSLPFVYSNEVWTGVEYEVASHLIFMGKVKEGLDIVQTCRKRYDGSVRNPFDEYECGHWYARAMSSYALLEALTGVRYDAVDQILYIDSKVGDFTSFLSTATGFGNVVYKDGKVTLQVKYGSIPVRRTVITKT
jgi:uncharacterized protein (DUF608 family)